MDKSLFIPHLDVVKWDRIGMFPTLCYKFILVNVWNSKPIVQRNANYHVFDAVSVCDYMNIPVLCGESFVVHLPSGSFTEQIKKAIGRLPFSDRVSIRKGYAGNNIGICFRKVNRRISIDYVHLLGDSLVWDGKHDINAKVIQ